MGCTEKDGLLAIQINELRSEIEEYLGIADVADTNAEVVIGTEAPASDLAAEGDV
jgi:hypothetical protein